jgi:tetratricopeptide (TPR) repeat protein
VNEVISTPVLPRRLRRWLLRLGAATVVLAALAALGVWLWSRHQLQATRDALQRGDWQEAEDHLDQYLRLWPNSAEAHFLAARTARQREAYPAAEEHLDACRRLHYPPEAVALEGTLLAAQQGKVSTVAEPLRRLVQQKHPETSLILEALARGYVRSGSPAEALECLILLLQREPDHLTAVLLRAQCQSLLGEHEEARASAAQAVRLSPNLAEARLVLANVLSKLGHVREAAAQYEWLRYHSDDRPEVLVRLALCLQDLAELDRAGKVLDELLAQHPRFVPGLVERGRVAFRLGQAEAGERWARRALELAPMDGDAPLILSLCQEARGQTEEARRSLELWKERYADAAALARLSVRLGASPGDAALHYQRGVLLLRLGHDQAGEQELQRALALDAGHRRAHAALADYYQRAGLFDRAARHRALAADKS